jgi:hypothetical protein
MIAGQTVVIGPRVTAFTTVCEICAADTGHGWLGASVQGTLELDLARGTFLCRRGHAIVVERNAGLVAKRGSEAA